MTYTLTFHQKDSYLHIIVTGVNSPENAMKYLDEVRRECAARHCRRILLEERLEGPRLGTLDVFKVAEEQSHRAAGVFEAIAYVDVNAEGDLMSFAENVTVNRAMPVKVLATVADAEKWLLDVARGTAGPRTSAIGARR